MNASSPLPLSWGKEAPRKLISLTVQNATAATNPLRRCDFAACPRCSRPQECFQAADSRADRAVRSVAMMAHRQAPAA